MAEAQVGLAILAAGQSLRFGAQDKLTVTFGGTMLGLHAPATLAPLKVARRWIIAADADHPCAPDWRAQGYDIVENTRAKEGMGTSVALAARVAEEAGLEALLVALADMPMVTLEHAQTLLVLAAPDALAASHDGTRHLPPALFGQEHFAQLQQLEGDQGARDLIARAQHISAAPETLVDIDTPEALQRFG